MGRGFLSGIFWGGIVGLVALFVSSQTLERQVLSFPQPAAAEVEVPGGSEFNQARPESDPVLPRTDARARRRRRWSRPSRLPLRPRHQRPRSKPLNPHPSRKNARR
mgnify:CR=1 FL=1